MFFLKQNNTTAENKRGPGDSKNCFGTCQATTISIFLLQWQFLHRAKCLSYSNLNWRYPPLKLTVQTPLNIDRETPQKEPVSFAKHPGFQGRGKLLVSGRVMLERNPWHIFTVKLFWFLYITSAVGTSIGLGHNFMAVFSEGSGWYTWRSGSTW